ncbi:hypothetical protein LJR225_001741 [Phenylobacterium sp. LjRoot225]|uniref:hypothetical protein n=1 Tax=Phenylobacterium sp. LjRoot225 TaxID=3342285 RepID=UPI003ED126E3
MVVVISVARVGTKWAVQHCGGYLGHTSSLEEATSIGKDLVTWLKGQGRQAELIVGETGSFAAPPPQIAKTGREGERQPASRAAM